MELTEKIKKCIDDSVLCWLATVSADGQPNVSPKEVFTYEEDRIIIANIASPQTAKNILKNEKICLSFIDVLVQKGFQLKGKAELLSSNSSEYEVYEPLLTKMTKGRYPFQEIICMTVSMVKPIIAPSYVLYPETSEEDQKKAARERYNL